MLACVDKLAPFPRRKRLDGFSGLLLGEPKVVEALYIQPKLSTRAKEMSETQGRGARDSTRSVQNLRNAIGRHVDLSRQCSRARLAGFPFCSQLVRRMRSGSCH